MSLYRAGCLTLCGVDAADVTFIVDALSETAKKGVGTYQQIAKDPKAAAAAAGKPGAPLLPGAPGAPGAQAPYTPPPSKSEGVPSWVIALGVAAVGAGTFLLIRRRSA